MKWQKVAASIVLFVLLSCLWTACENQGSAERKQFDLVLSGGVIIDGAGGPRYTADIGVRDGRIAAIGALENTPTAAVLDVSGFVVSPGFIDTHSHADKALQYRRTASIEGFLKQGVTTAVYGVDGYASLGDFKANIAAGEARLMGVNFMSYVGHNGVRTDVLGRENRAPTPEELDRMRADVKEAMELGAVGLSSGLMYIPGKFASTEEVIELAKVVAPYGGKYDSHIRDPANRWVESVVECLDIAREAGVDAHVAHLKAVGAKNFGKSQEVIDLINMRIAAGEKITADVYPYDGASTRRIASILYPANDEEGRDLHQRLAFAASESSKAEAELRESIEQLRAYWRSIELGGTLYEAAKANTEAPSTDVFSWVGAVGYQSMRIVVSANPDYEGKMVVALADALGITPFELFRRLVIEEGADAMVTLGAIREDEVRAIMRQPWSMISSDGSEINVQHPRGRGSFPRVLGRYARDWGVFTLEEGVHKITGAPAAYLELADRGVIREGAIADMVVFRPEMVIDRASWTEPALYAEGIEHVIIGGEFAVRDGELTQNRLGRFIPFTPAPDEHG